MSVIAAPRPGTQDLALLAQNRVLRELLAKAGVDSAARDVADDIQRVLTEEIHHRIKNMLTMVTAIVRQSVATAPTLEHAESAITARLIAMAKAQDLLLKSDWLSAGLTGIIAAAVDLHAGASGRITIAGDEVTIVPSCILPLTLILNELGTNATKYGALSNDDGRIGITVKHDTEAATLTLTWTEHGGPPITPSTNPPGKSFGTKLIEGALPRQLHGEGHLTFAPTGVTYTLTLPTEALLAAPA